MPNRLPRGTWYLVIGALGVLPFIFKGNMVAPVINDVSTDLIDPPAFVKAKIGPLPESFKKQIERSYPNLKPLLLGPNVSGSTVFAAALKAAEGMPRWQLTVQDEAQGIIEGVATTLMLRFKDDFVIRIKPAEGGVKVDMRSKSRLGKGDLGANAHRIMTYLAKLSIDLGDKQ